MSLDICEHKILDEKNVEDEVVFVIREESAVDLHLRLEMGLATRGACLDIINSLIADGLVQYDPIRYGI